MEVVIKNIKKTGRCLLLKHAHGEILKNIHALINITSNCYSAPSGSRLDLYNKARSAWKLSYDSSHPWTFLNIFPQCWQRVTFSSLKITALVFISKYFYVEYIYRISNSILKIVFSINFCHFLWSGILVVQNLETAFFHIFQLKYNFHRSHIIQHAY